MGPKEAFMFLNTIAVGTAAGGASGAAGGASGAAGGAAAGAENTVEKEINGYPEPDFLEGIVWNWVQAEKTNGLIATEEEDDEKEAFYEKQGRRCQRACEKTLTKKRGELDLTREWIKTKIEEFLTCEYEYYKDKNGKEYKNEEDAVCWFCCRQFVPNHQQYWCEHERFQKDGSVKTCPRICCTECSPQAPDFDPAKDVFFCKIHMAIRWVAKYLKVQETRKPVEYMESVEEHVYKPKPVVKQLDVFKNVGGERNVSYPKVLGLLGIDEHRPPTAGEYKRACICTTDDDGIPTFTLRNEPLPEEKIEVKLTFPKDKAGHYWYDDYNGKTYDKAGFLELFKTVRKDMIEELDDFPILKKKKRTAENELKEDKTREKLAERVDLLNDLMSFGRACFTRKEWKDYNKELNKYWERLDLRLLPGEKAYDLNIAKKDLMKFAEAQEENEV
jgi:hypothetical protein